MDNLLLEIGVEEIPSDYIQPAVAMLSDGLRKQLSDARINYGHIDSYATSRRIAILAHKVSQNQNNINERIYGPPEKIGIDSNGNYSIPAIKFAEKVGLSLSQLDIVSKGKGRYISAIKKEIGQPTKKILEIILPKLILSISFPKSMRWGDLSIRFARPIRSIVAIFGSDIINFKLSKDIKSGRISTGHLLMSNENIAIFNPKNYLNIMKKANVIVDIDERRSLTLNSARDAAHSIGGKILLDNELLDKVANFVEFPVAVTGKFDKSFLNMPKEILITTMQEHQKYFAVVDDNKKLLPNFVAIHNNLSKNMKLITSGHERVLRARLSDASFFYNSDILKSIESWVEKLKDVLFHYNLGSIYDKILRIKEIAIYLRNKTKNNNVNIDKISRAAYLCKADLNSQVVMEFPKLQGIMGSIYARLAGESEKVCIAIKEHYKPTKSGDKTPQTKVGALISIADKIDSICGYFSVGLEPTGTADPHALRRQAIGLIRTVLHMKFNFNINQLINKSIEQYNDISSKNNNNAISKKVFDFLKTRFYQILLDKGHSLDVITSVVSTFSNDIVKAEKYIYILEIFKKKKHLEPIITAFKRIDNILTKSKFISSNIPKVSDTLFKDSSEFLLYKSSYNSSKKIDILLNIGDISGAINTMISLCNPIDLFFEQVMVMDEDKEICYNRLALLNDVLNVFLKVSNFKHIAV